MAKRNPDDLEAEFARERMRDEIRALVGTVLYVGFLSLVGVGIWFFSNVDIPWTLVFVFLLDLLLLVVIFRLTLSIARSRHL